MTKREFLEGFDDIFSFTAMEAASVDISGLAGEITEHDPKLGAKMLAVSTSIGDLLTYINARREELKLC